MNTLTRVLRTVTIGKDVEGVTRAMLRYLGDDKGWKAFMAATPLVKRTWGPGKTTLAKRCAKKAGLPQAGVFGPGLETALRKAGAFDLKANKLLDEYAAAHQPKPKPPALVEPLQGFDSLVKDLWPLYSVGRNMGLTDLGTFNRRSILPHSRRPSDHATSRLDGRICEPACAVDLGFTPATGQANDRARAFYDACKGRPEVKYVICGNKIWSVDRGEHHYDSGGHEGHVHVSGHRR